MRRPRLVVMVLAALLGCHDGPTSPVAGARSSANAPHMQAIPTISHVTLPLSTIYRVDCANGGAGESVTVTGVYRRHNVIVYAPPGELVAANTVVIENLRGIGQTTGDKYVGKYMLLNQDTAAPGSDARTSTFIFNFHLAAAGPENNRSWHITSQVIENADGEVTVVVDNNSGVQCT